MSDLFRTIGNWVVAPMTTLLAASFAIYGALTFAPGDPVGRLLGPRATEAQRLAARARLGLDDPLLVRYWHWLENAVHGDLGTSIVYRQDVIGLLIPRLTTTLTLVAMSTGLIAVFGVSLGTLGGSNPRWKTAVNVVSGVGVSIPSYVAASLLVAAFAIALGWFPTYGAGSGFSDRIWHLTLPAIALSIGYGAYITQITSAAVCQEAGKPHVDTATGRGIPRSVIVRRHILRNAAAPVLTASGSTIAGLVAGSVVVESAFAVDGLGSLLVKSVSSKDYDVVTAISLFIVLVFVVITTVIDMAQDPEASRGRNL